MNKMLDLKKIIFHFVSKLGKLFKINLIILMISKVDKCVSHYGKY